MTNIESAIVKKLKAELERKDEDYCQWILGAAIKKEKGRLTQGAINYTARVVMKTNESIYVDGMDIEIKANGSEVILAPDYFENTPEYQGGEIVDAINWMKNLGDICYLQFDNPYYEK